MYWSIIMLVLYCLWYRWLVIIVSTSIFVKNILWHVAYLWGFYYNKLPSFMIYHPSSFVSFMYAFQVISCWWLFYDCANFMFLLVMVNHQIINSLTLSWSASSSPLFPLAINTHLFTSNNVRWIDKTGLVPLWYYLQYML